MTYKMPCDDQQQIPEIETIGRKKISPKIESNKLLFLM